MANKGGEMVPKTLLKISLLALLFSLAGVLAIACTARTPAAPAETATPTATASLTPTWNPTQRYQATLQLNQTQNAAHATTRAGYSAISSATAAAVALTPTATPTPTALPAWILNGPEDYELAEVNAGMLLDSLIDVYLFYRDSFGCDYELQDCSLVEFRLDDSWRTLELLENQATEITAGEMAEALLQRLDVLQEKDLYIDWSRHGPVFDRGFHELVISYLNENGARFLDGQGITSPRFTSTVRQADIDDDPEPEWLLKVYFEHFEFVEWMLLDESPEGEYTQIDFPFSRWLNTYFIDQLEIRVEDLTGDAKDDLAIVSDFYVGGGGSILEFEIYTFRDGLPEQISAIVRTYHGFPEESYDYQWLLNAETGLHGLELIWTAYSGWDCVEIGSTQISWEGGEEHRTENPIGEPESINCLIARSLNFYGPPPTATAIHWLEKALGLNNTSQELSEMDLTFVYFRLAMLHLLNDNPFTARTYLSRIQSQGAAGAPEIAVLLWNEIRPLVDENRLNPYTLCAASMALSLPIDDINPRGDIISYEYAGKAAYQDPLCNPHRIMLEAMNRIGNKSDQSSLESSIRDAGLPLIEVRPVDLGGENTGWIVAVENLNFGNAINMGFLRFPGPNITILGISVEEEWRTLGTLSSENFQSVSHDWNGDGLSEIGFASLDPEMDHYCQEGDAPYEVLWISAFKIGATVAVSHSPYCFPENLVFDWTEIAMDSDGDLLSDWLFDQLVNWWDYIEDVEFDDPEETWIFDESDLRVVTKSSLLSDLDERLLESNPLLIRSEINQWIDDWSNEALDLRNLLFEHLTYLLGLTYELEGNESRAVEVYHELWSTYPDSIFGRLAASRLELRP